MVSAQSRSQVSRADKENFYVEFSLRTSPRTEKHKGQSPLPLYAVRFTSGPVILKELAMRHLAYLVAFTFAGCISLAHAQVATPGGAQVDANFNASLNASADTNATAPVDTSVTNISSGASNIYSHTNISAPQTPPRPSSSSGGSTGRRIIGGGGAAATITGPGGR